MTHRLMLAVAAVTLMAATGFANAQDAATSRDAPSAPAQQPRTETLSTRHADPTADRTVGESMKPEKNSGDGDLAAAVRIDQQMSRESEGGFGHRRGR
jgi:Ni/Co efflux regulator RcnB